MSSLLSLLDDALKNLSRTGSRGALSLLNFLIEVFILENELFTRSLRFWSLWLFGASWLSIGVLFVLGKEVSIRSLRFWSLWLFGGA